MKTILIHGCRAAILTIPFAATLLTASAQTSENLIQNGNFSDRSYTGPTYWPVASPARYNSFSSDYVVGWDTPLTWLGTEGSLVVASNPRSYNNNFLAIGDHTSGDGSMLIVNGAVGSSAAGAVIWQQSIGNLSADTLYSFEAWATNINDPASWYGDNAYSSWKNSQAILDMEIWDATLWNDDTDTLGGWLVVGQIDLTSDSVDSTAWNSFSGAWYNLSNTDTVLRLVNQQTAAAGNDFALDDISFSPVVIAPPGVPEPSALALAGLSLLAILRRKRSA